MGFNEMLLGNEQTTVETAKILEISKKTIRFGSDVYQFRNVTGFGIGKVKSRKIPLWIIIVSFFIFGLSIIGLIIPIGMIIYNISQPDLYGLKLYLNSGDGKIFITTDTVWLKKAVFELYEFLESDEEGTYILNIQDKSIKVVESSVVGSLIGNENEY